MECKRKALATDSGRTNLSALLWALIVCSVLLTGCIGSSSSSDDNNNHEESEEQDGSNGDDESDNGDTGDGEDENGDSGDSDELLTMLVRQDGSSNFDFDDRITDMDGIARAGDTLIANAGFTSVALIDPDTGEFEEVDFSEAFDINTTIQTFSPNSNLSMETEDVFYFQASRIGSDDYLYRSDGTVEGTYPVSSEGQIGAAGVHGMIITNEGLVVQADTSLRDGDCLFRVVEDEQGKDSLASHCGVRPERVNAQGRMVLYNGSIHYVVDTSGGDDDAPDDFDIRRIHPGDIDGTGPVGEQVWSLPFEDGDDDRNVASFKSAGPLFIAANDRDGQALHTPQGTSSSNRLFSPKKEDEFASGALALTKIGDSMVFFTRPWRDDITTPDFSSNFVPATASGSSISLKEIPDQLDRIALSAQGIVNSLFNSTIPGAFGNQHLFPIGGAGTDYSANNAHWWAISSGGVMQPVLDNTNSEIATRESRRNALALETDNYLYLNGSPTDSSDRHLFRFTSLPANGVPLDLSDQVSNVESLASIGDTVFILGQSQESDSDRRIWRLND